MPTTQRTKDPALVSTKTRKQSRLQDDYYYDNVAEEDLPFGERLGRNFDSFMTYVCFPEEQMDYICFPEERNLEEGLEELEQEQVRRPVTVIVKKESRHEKLGISIRKAENEGGIIIYKLNKDGKFAGTDLEVGMKILSINDEACPPTVPETIATLKLAEGTVKIVGEPPKDSGIVADDSPREAAPGAGERALVSKNNNNNGNTVSFTDYFTSSYTEYENAITNMSINRMLEAMTGLEAYSEEEICIQKEGKGEKLGVALMQSKTSDNIYVNHVWENSKFAAAGLKAGVKVVKVNGQCCPASLEETVSLLNNAEGRLNLTVIVDDNFCHELDETFMMNGKKLANKVTVRLQKEKDEPIGMLLRKYEDREGVFVRKLSENGKAAKTTLQPHMKILLINGQRCPQNMEDCTQMISEIEGELKIVAVSNIPEELMGPVDA
eukprot:CAMPEP_0113618416 /NCGR_PEP_ID=MMETSP0017_2-20120614/9320_1 /TAXON_ID=2856 /ORGANISM="Cylindrotheca closterium" /LENGTH=436 /DNA_ID=CAMNT_0000527913 /DNA_START=56 /DNA_END=1366 /DNA_ORIENTATION=+ /assembly_acc=CAM_ASM_000147